MSNPKIKLMLEAEVNQKGEDYTYRETIDIEVQEDPENSDRVAFNVDDKEFFIKKEDLETVLRVLK